MIAEVRELVLRGLMKDDICREMHMGQNLFRRMHPTILATITDDEKRAAYVRMKANKLNERSIVYLLGLDHRTLAQYQRELR